MSLNWIFFLFFNFFPIFRVEIETSEALFPLSLFGFNAFFLAKTSNNEKTFHWLCVTSAIKIPYAKMK